MVRQDRGRPGYCVKHYDKTKHTARIIHYNKTVKAKPKHLHRKSENIHSIPSVCVVCGRNYLATPGAIKRGGGVVCSGHCHGVRAAQLTPKAETSIEKAIEQILVELEIGYQKQVPLLGVTLADFVLTDHRVVIFCDGDYWHSLPKAIERANRQGVVLSDNGYSVYRFTETQIKASALDCIKSISF